MSGFDYYRSNSYKGSVKLSNDELKIDKVQNSDWYTITMITNSEENGMITIRDQEMAAQLHYITGRLLGK